MRRFDWAHAVFLRNVSYFATEADVREAFAARMGGVAGCYLLAGDVSPRENKGCGFLYLATEVDQRTALDLSGRVEVDGRAILVQEARPRPEKNPSAFRGERIQSR
jgi:RNA recognition motif-containing protein